jgi:hypothetical protein
MLKSCYALAAATHWAKRDVDGALQKAQSALRVVPADPQALYNAGVVGWYRSTVASGALRPTGAASGMGSEDGSQESTSTPNPWREPLQKFLSLAVLDSTVPVRCREVAQQILGGQFAQRPPLFVPSVREARPRIEMPADCPPCPLF